MKNENIAIAVICLICINAISLFAVFICGWFAFTLDHQSQTAYANGNEFLDFAGFKVNTTLIYDISQAFFGFSIIYPSILLFINFLILGISLFKKKSEGGDKNRQQNNPSLEDLCLLILRILISDDDRFCGVLPGDLSNLQSDDLGRNDARLSRSLSKLMNGGD